MSCNSYWLFVMDVVVVMMVFAVAGLGLPVVEDKAEYDVAMKMVDEVAVGKVEKVSREESEEYFNSRPVGSRIGAWASAQSSVVGEEELVQKVDEMKDKFGEDVPCPPHWGGWRIIPL